MHEPIYVEHRGQTLEVCADCYEAGVPVDEAIWPCASMAGVSVGNFDPRSALAEHQPVQVQVKELMCALGSVMHPNDHRDCPSRVETVCKACAPLGQGWYDPEHLWPCVARLSAERLMAAGFGFDLGVSR